MYIIPIVLPNVFINYLIIGTIDIQFITINLILYPIVFHFILLKKISEKEDIKDKNEAGTQIKQFWMQYFKIK